MSSTADIIKTLTAKFNTAAAAGLDLVFQFNIEDAENYYLTVKDGTCDVQAGDNDDANVTLIMDRETFKEIA
ncbi:MAG TPA: SCP2 sterol-binding domain-containing protein, partial [Thiopseudomonas sp.]|nr:SCP2 sterol-binding domain-containing protein [Thiopseudomonas sp.]